MNIYQISGLGAGKEVYDRINLNYPSMFLPWIRHKKNENLQQYAQRMAEKIDTTRPFCLMGVSFGGIVCIEMARFLKPEKIFIISSVKNRKEIPFYIKVAGHLRLFNLLSPFIIRNTKGITHFLFGAKRLGEKQFLNDILDSIDVSYMKWCLTKIGTWKNLHDPQEIIHIHGDSDFLFPRRFMKNVDYWVTGGHFVSVRRGREISNILNNEMGN